MRADISREKLNVLTLFITMLPVCLIVAGAAIAILYQTAFTEEHDCLMEHAQSQANLMEAVARFDSRHGELDHPGGAIGAILSQIIDAHEKYDSFGNSGELLFGKLAGNEIHFLFSHQLHHCGPLPPVQINSSLAESMRRALRRESGTMIGPGYRNTIVPAAYQPVQELNLGIVVKIDLAEIRAPFLRVDRQRPAHQRLQAHFSRKQARRNCHIFQQTAVHTSPVRTRQRTRHT